MNTSLHLLSALLPLALVALVGCGPDTSAEVDQSSEDLLGDVSPLGPEPSGDPTQYPILVAHGFLASANGFGSFNALITDALTADGHVVARGSVPPFAGVSVRATYLAADVDELLAETGAAKVNIIAHSMGGLDVRELVSVLGYGDRVASVTTIATPHRGSAVADVALGLVAGNNEAALDEIAKEIGRTYSDVSDDADVIAALTDLSEAGSDGFNSRHPDDPGVYYQSWAGVSSFLCIPNPADVDACDDALVWHEGRADCLSPLLVAAAPFVAHGTDSNDGQVLVSSAKWGDFRGCVPADHADEIGFLRKRALDGHTGFDFVRFYRNIAFDLAARGF